MKLAVPEVSFPTLRYRRMIEQSHCCAKGLYGSDVMAILLLATFLSRWAKTTLTLVLPLTEMRTTLLPLAGVGFDQSS